MLITISLSPKEGLTNCIFGSHNIFLGGDTGTGLIKYSLSRASAISRVILALGQKIIQVNIMKSCISKTQLTQIWEFLPRKCRADNKKQCDYQPNHLTNCHSPTLHGCAELIWNSLRVCPTRLKEAPTVTPWFGSCIVHLLGCVYNCNRLAAKRLLGFNVLSSKRVSPFPTWIPK